MFEPEVFRKEIYCVEERTCKIVGTIRGHQQTFGAPLFSGTRRIVPPFPPRRYAPVLN